MKILIVEDHSGTRLVLERMLESWGYEVATAKDLGSALTHLKWRRFDAIVSDIALPDGSGYAVMSEARRAGSDALAIAISAWPFPPEVQEPKVTGFDHHLSKPFDPNQLHCLLEGDEVPSDHCFG